MLYNIQASIYPGIAQLVARVVWDHQVGGSSPSTRTIKRRKTAEKAVFLRLMYEFQSLPDYISKVVNCSKDCAQWGVSRWCGPCSCLSDTVPVGGSDRKHKKWASFYVHIHIFRFPSKGKSRQDLFPCLCDAISALAGYWTGLAVRNSTTFFMRIPQ